MATDNRLVIRAGQGTLAFLTSDEQEGYKFHPYPIKSSMSLSANLREAFREEEYLHRECRKARLLVSSPIVLIPKDDYNDTEDFDVETTYNSVITGHKGEEKIVCEIPELDAVAIYTVNSDLRMVVGDNVANVEVCNVMVPVWKHLYNRYYQAGQYRKMFAVFHDKKVDICCFEQHRLRFANVFDATHAHDCLYFILYVWKQLGLNQQEDALFVTGDMPHENWLMERLSTYINKVHVINPQADLNRSPLSLIKDMPFDMML